MVVVVADGPAIRRRQTLDIVEGIPRLACVGRADDGPRGPIPALDQGLDDEWAVWIPETADRPAIRVRRALDAIKVVVMSRARVGRADDGPRGPIPMLDQGLVEAVVVRVVTDCPAIRLREARQAIEKVVLCGTGTGRADN